MPEKFGRNHRIRERSEFMRAYRTGQRYENEHFKIYLLRQESLTPRLGLTVPKRVGNAVTRNRLKRLIREWFRQRKSLLAYCDLVIQPTERACPLSQTEVAASLDSLIESIEDPKKNIESV